MLISLLPLLFVSQKGVIRLEAEKGELFGPVVSTARAGYSGTGYVSDMTAQGAHVVWHFRGKAGVYRLNLRYSASGDKGVDASINGLKISATAPATGEAFSTASLGRVEVLSGDNTITLERGWGYFDADYLELIPSKGPERVGTVPDRVCDPQATIEARHLYSHLLASYGKSTFSGQYETGRANTHENDFIRTETGVRPTILGGDLADYSPSRVIHQPVVDLVPGWIDGARKGQKLTLSWHWNAPTQLIDDPHHKTADGKVENDGWGYGFYTRASTFNLDEVLANPSGVDYQTMLSDIDAIAIQLRRLQDAHIPVLWRPLHEAQGGWFWWGARGPEACKKLWRILYDRLTRVDGIHNLIWVWNSPKPEWYPGDDVVDVMSTDDYPADHGDPLTSDWDSLLHRFNGRKPVALAEFPGVPDLARMQKLGVWWMYFVSWYGDVGPRKTSPVILKESYHLPTAIKLLGHPGLH